MFKNIIASGITALIVAILVVGLVGGNSKTATLGGITNYDQIRVDSLGIGQDPAVATGEAIVKGTGTSTIAITGTKGCIQMINSVGSTTAMYIVGSGASTNTATFSVGTCK